jgi:cytochrome P450
MTNDETPSLYYPPGPSQKLPLILFLNFLRDPIKVLSGIAQIYGDISHFKFGNQHIYFINHPDYIRDVLVTYNSNFIKSRGSQLAKKVLGEGILTSEGNLHYIQRQLMQPAFHQERIAKSYSNIMVDYVLRISDHWQDNDVLDIHKEFMRLALAIVCKSLFNFDIDELEAEDVSNYVTILVEYFNRARIPLAKLIEKLPLPKNKQFLRAKYQLDTIIYRIINEHERNFSINNTVYDSNNYNDIVSMLIANKQNNIDDVMASDTILSKSQLRDNIITIFLAGHETVANALTWTFYLLSENGKEENKLHDEVDSVLGKNNNNTYREKAIPTATDIPKLEYTEKVFAESMRLYPPAWAIGRQAIKDCRIGKYTIPAGSTVLMSQYLIHRDPRFFPEPLKFDPERWNIEARKNLPRFSYFPFGGGPRACIGEQFAWMEGILTIATIARKWTMKLESSKPIILQPLVTLRPRYGMQMKLIQRR